MCGSSLQLIRVDAKGWDGWVLREKDVQLLSQVAARVAFPPATKQRSRGPGPAGLRPGQFWLRCPALAVAILRGVNGISLLF